MNGITIVGLGPGSFGQVSMAAWDALQHANKLYLRTAVHPTVAELQRHSVSFSTFDSLYETAERFADIYQEIATQIVAIGASEPVTYAVPGHPLVAETSVELMLEKARMANVPVRIIPSMSALDAMFAAAHIDPGHGLQVIDALEFAPSAYKPETPAIFLQVYNRFHASNLKLELLNMLDPDLEVTLIIAAGVPGQEHVIKTPLHEFDRQDNIDHLTSLYIPASTPLQTTAQAAEHPLDPLVNVLRQLRAENGCPWDRKQTHATLKPYLIEESYETLDAIDAEDWSAVCEELGDVLLQVVFHAQLGAENGTFTIDEVIDTITAKMIRRHPHVFANVEANDVSTVLRNWDLIKQEEKADQGKQAAESLLDGVPRHLPALMQAEEVQKKAAKVGFEWADVKGAVEKVVEEAVELQDALKAGHQEDMFSELGDLLFAIVNVARYLHIDAEEALRATIAKFKRRFRHIEVSAAAANRNLTDMTVEEMDQYWNEAKELEILKK